MAIAYNPKDEEELRNQDATLGAEGSIVGGNSAPSGQTEGSGQYTNLQSYLDTNKNSGLGMGIADNVGKAITGAEQAQSKLGVDFRKASDQGYVPTDRENIKYVTENPWAAYGSGQAGMKQAKDNGLEGKTDFSGLTGMFNPKQDPQSGLKAPTLQTQGAQSATPAVQNYANPVSNFKPTDAVNKFRAQRDAVYSGPSEQQQEAFYQPVRRANTEATELGKIAGSESGNRALLKKYYQGDRGNYTEGMLNLDSLLARNDQGAKNRILQEQARAAKLNPAFSNLQNELGTYRNQRRADTQATRNAARQAIGIDDQGSFLNTGPIQGILDATQARSDAATAQRGKDVPLLTQSLRNQDISGLSDAYKSKLGLGDVSSLYNIDPSSSNYLSFVAAGDLDRNGVTTQDELNNLNALTDLGNVGQQWINPDEIGKFKSDIWKYDTRKFKSDLAANRADYEKSRRGLQFTKTGSPVEGLIGGPITRDIDDQLADYQRIGSNAPYGRNSLGGALFGPDDRFKKDKAERADFERLKKELGTFEIQGGARKLLKGTNKNVMDLSEDQKNDILRGWIKPDDLRGRLDDSKRNDLERIYGSQFVEPGRIPGRYWQPSMGGRWKEPGNAPRIEDEQSARGLEDYRALQAMMGDAGGGRFGGKASGLPTNIQGYGNTQEEKLINNYLMGQFGQGGSYRT